MRRTALYELKAIISDSSKATTADGMYCFVDVVTDEKYCFVDVVTDEK